MEGGPLQEEVRYSEIALQSYLSSSIPVLGQATYVTQYFLLLTRLQYPTGLHVALV